MSAEALQLPGVGDIVGEGRFELLRELGEGGMSTVFVAADRHLGREVALKLLTPRYVGRPEREQRLINEAEYLRRVQGHPNVIEFIDVGRLGDRNGWPWLSTEILVGEDLGWLFTRGKVEIPRVVSIARQTALALAACHEAGVVHRDVTPGNVFVLEGEQTIKLFDFSHAADLHAPKLPVGASERLTTIFDTPGTLGYMGPEQVMKAPADVSMDAFAFGILLYKLVTGRDPYHQFTDRSEFIKAQREGKLEQPRLHAWAYDAPEALADLVHDCTQRDGTKRPTMREVVARLEAMEASSTAEPAASESTTTVEAPEEVTAAVDVVALHPRWPSAPEPEVTAPVDARALIQPRRPARRTAPEVIGDWTTVPREQDHPAPTPALAVPAPVVVSSPAVALSEPEEQTAVELPFARPPHLRDAPAVEIQPEPPSEPELAFARPPDQRPVAVVIDEPQPGPADEQQDEGEPSESIDSPPKPRHHGRISRIMAAALLGVGLLLVIAWAVLDLGQRPTDHDRAAPSDRIDGDDPTGEQRSPEPGLDEETETGAHLEPVPEAESPPDHETEPKPKPKPKPKPVDGTCEGVEAEARAASGRRKWAKVIQLTERKSCWSSNDERTRLRVSAFLLAKRNEECVKAGRNSRDPEVVSMVKTCEALVNQATSSGP